MINKKYLSAIGSILLGRKETIAMAESVTSGYLQFVFSQAENASGFFQGGITAYNLGQKVRHLGIEPIHAEENNCVSLQAAVQMAIGSTKLFTSHWGIGITGYATPLSLWKIKKPFAFYAITYNTKVLFSNRVDSTRLQGKPSQEYFVQETLKSFHKLLSTI